MPQAGVPVDPELNHPYGVIVNVMSPGFHFPQSPQMTNVSQPVAGQVGEIECVLIDSSAKAAYVFLWLRTFFLAIRVGGFRKCLASLLAGELTVDICVCVFVHMCALGHVQGCFGVGLHVLPQMCEAASMVLAGTWPLLGWLYRKDRPHITSRSK